MDFTSNHSLEWRTTIEANRQKNLDDLLDFVRIASVSTLEENIEDVQRAAVWIAERLTRSGFDNVEMFPTGPHCCVYADWLHAPGKPTILIYGHFDVQPADPLELWESPPFEPAIRDGKIFGRGTTDMKANLLLALTAMEAMLATVGALPVNVKCLFEGQEEIGSRDLGPFVVSHRELLACDLILTPDSLQWNETQPVLWMGTKGLCGLQVDLETSDLDLHSGLYGGAVPNAAHAMVELLSTLHDHQGGILVKGFYDQVEEISESERLRFNKIPFDWAEYASKIGVDAAVGEPSRSTHERLWVRPTLEVNGLWSGFQGEGIKTVIPSQAHAKISCRLVPNQDPSDVLDRLEEHIQAFAPLGARIEINRFHSQSRAYRVPLDHPAIEIVSDALTSSYGKKPYLARIGGSLPIIDTFLQELGVYTIPVGFGLDDERAHSPNEFMRITSFERGQRVYANLLHNLSQLAPPLKNHADSGT